MNTHSTVLAAAVVLITIGVMLVWIDLNGGEASIRQLIQRCPDVRDAKLEHALARRNDPKMVDGNCPDVVLNGDELFPAMLASLRGKETAIAFDSYIYWPGQIDDQLASPPSGEAQSDVRVYVLLDWLEAKYPGQQQPGMLKQA